MSLYRQLMLGVATLADPHCKNPRDRLRQIAAMLDHHRVDKLIVAQACLEELEREQMSPPRRAMWRKATRRLAEEKRRRHRSLPKDAAKL